MNRLVAVIASATTKQGTTAPREPPIKSPISTVWEVLAIFNVGEGPIRKAENPHSRLAGTMKKRLSIDSGTSGMKKQIRVLEPV